MHIDTETEEIISCGFPKFMLLDKGNEEYNIDLNDLLKANDLIATTKIDGTCLLRYVQDGKVKWRTKQSFWVQMENAFEIEDFTKQYPKLNDPSFCHDLTLIFEWVSPFNPIIVKYDIPDITLIGAIRYDVGVPWHAANINMLQLDALSTIAHSCNVKMVPSFQLRTTNDVLGLIETTRSSDQMEGYVLRLNKDQDLVKIKSDWWLILFACKIQFTTALAVELWLYWEKPDWGTYQQKFMDDLGLDAWYKAAPLVSAMYDGIKRVQRIMDHLQTFCDQHQTLSEDQFESQASDRFNMLRLDACKSIRKQQEVNPEIWKKLILQNSIQMEKIICEQ